MWLAILDWWCRWQHREHHYGTDYPYWRCRLCDDEKGIPWKKL